MERSRKKRSGIVLLAVTVAVLLMAGTGIFLYGQFGEADRQEFDGTFVQREDIQVPGAQEERVRLADVQPDVQSDVWSDSMQSLTTWSAGVRSVYGGMNTEAVA